MYEVRNKRSKRICKWIASLLTIALLINESGIPVLAAEITETGDCSCSVRCNADSIKEDCPVCLENYGQCKVAKQEEAPIQAETQEQQEGDVPETTVQEPVVTEQEIPVNQESGAEDKNEAANDDSQPELNNTSYVYENEAGLEPGTEAAVTTGTESESGIVEISEVFVSEAEVVAAGELAVATQEELAAALLAGAPRITLAADISLTTTMIVPATANIVLDGQGFSLHRGADENGAFIGTMLYLNGAKDAGGSLTLMNICVDGQTASAANRAGSSAIMDFGNLILDEGAVVKGNFNYGTYASQENEGITAVINDYGGGIQVYGELTVTERALVTGNFADEFGGGVYLAEGATLYLHADVIRENAVAEGSGYGADLYAATGSTIYYNTAIDMTRDGFYLCTGVNLIGMDMPVAYAENLEDTNVEVYINISEKSGYTQEQIAEITRKLEDKGYKVLANRTNIDTTDLRDWYVYDHYDTNAWTALQSTWEDEYGGNDRRGFYPYSEAYYNYVNGPLASASTVTNPVYTIEDWLKCQDDYYVSSYNCITLAQFKEHIYTRKENGYPEMTFVGYGHPAYIDFLFYDPESDGEKVVDFDVDSSQVQTHTLTGTGFLVNTGIKDQKLYGYLVYYAYTEATTAANSVKIYYLNGISAESLHNGTYDLKSSSSILGSPIAEHQIQGSEWENEMSIQIKATPTSIEVRQQPKGNASNIDQKSPILTCELPGSDYSGFGPLVAYTSVGHNCMKASSFTYSNLRMYFTNPPGDMLDALEKADFTQEDTQKYFINLFGNSDSKYNYTAGMGQYENYLKIMQSEGIALITDRDAPFEEYLGESNAPDSNLCEITKEGEGLLSVDSLIEQIIAYVDTKKTTNIQDKLQQGDGEGNLTEVNPKQSVGNIWLKSASSGKQIRTVDGDSIGEGGFQIQIMDDISYYHDEAVTVAYYVIKPNGDIETLASPFVEVGKNSKEWPAGEYTVQQKISGASVYGYAYFNLKRRDPETVTSHTVTINAHKDDVEWGNSGKTFVLAAKNVEPMVYINDFNHVPNGVYSVYDTTGAADNSAYADTGVTVTVSGSDAAAVVDYYTVTFYDESDIWGTPQIVIKNKTADVPVENPIKDGCTFSDWSTSTSGNTAFDFTSPITAKTDVYACWLYAVAINVHKDDSEWNDSAKTFALAAKNEDEIIFIEDLNRVPKGDYNVYDTTGMAEMDAYENTGVTMTVAGAGAAATVDYYTVTFYDESIALGTSQIVRKNKTANAPVENPTKDGSTFYRWNTLPDGSEAFDFTGPITAKTDVYASWLYAVAVNVHKDGSEWNDSAKTFALAVENEDEITFFEDLNRVPKGSYSIYDTTGLSDINAYEDTGVIVGVSAGATAVIDYYTVTLYNDDTVWGTPQIVRKNKTASAPAENPAKDGYTFYRWSTSKEDSSTDFNFGTPITAKTDIYASWKKDPDKTFTITVSAGTGGSVSPSGDVIVKAGDNQQFVITPDEGYQVASVLVDNNVVQNNAIPVTYSSAVEGMNTISGSVTLTTDASAAIEINANANTKANDKIKYYLFENVTENHTLTATFERVKTKSRKHGSSPEPEHYDTPVAPVSSPAVKTDTPVIVEEAASEVPAPNDNEPKTGDGSYVEVYATIGMIAGLSYLLLYFADGESGMTEEQKKEIVGALVKWARKGTRFRKYVALAIVFVILVYYHSIGKRTTTEWKELCE